MAKRLDLKDVNIYYGSFHAVADVALAVPPRSVTAFIGPSGCGKSTVLRALNRMHEVIPGGRVEGSVLLDGEDIYGSGVDPVSVRQDHRHGVPAAESLPDHVDQGQRGRRPEAAGCAQPQALDETAERSLKGANLWNEVKDRLDKPGGGLSGGQQQRLCIARAIAVQPDVLLMDEPCSALDPISTLAIEDLIAELKQDYTIVIVTHNMQQAARVSDQTAFFNLEATGKPGKLVEVDDTEKIFSNPDPEGHRGLHLRPVRLSTITRWDDPAIKALNPTASLPSEDIRVVYRSDESGTTDNFQQYLDAASDGAWSQGTGKTFNGGVGQGAKGNEGTSAAVKNTEGTITYNEYSFAQAQRLSTAEFSPRQDPIPWPSPQQRSARRSPARRSRARATTW